MESSESRADVSAVQGRIDQNRARWVEAYPAAWQRITAEWRADGADDRAWLMYSANYLLRTGTTRWAIDPLRLKARVREAAEVDVAAGLRGLAFVLLTHSHADHLDLELIRALRGEPVWWVVPEFLRARVIEQAGIPRSRLVVPELLKPFEIGGVTLTAFDGLHWEETPTRMRGVPAVGYLVEFNHRRWLFAGDVRGYDAGRLPPFGRLDGAFAHLWLGRASALCESPPLLEAFCDFYAHLAPARLVITHLNELGRAADDYWDDRHVEPVAARLPGMDARACKMGESVRL